jgi:hypothetical protein
MAFTSRLRKTSARRLSGEGCVICHRLKCGLLPADEVGRISQHVRRGEGRMGGVIPSGLIE